jgi:hypothetical protein
MKLLDRFDIGQFSIIFFVLFLLIGFWFDVEELKWSHIFFILAEAALSVCITLYVIEFAIRRSNERKWNTAKLLTYLAVISNLRAISSGAIPFATSLIGSDTLADCTEILNGPESKPRREIMIAIIDLYKKIDNYYKIHMLRYGETFAPEVYEFLISYYDNILWRLEDITITLIPRVIELSDDEDVNVELLNFEHASRVFADIMRLQRDSNIVNIPFATYSLAVLLKETGILYDVLLQRMETQPQGSPLERFAKIIAHWWLPD